MKTVKNISDNDAYIVITGKLKIFDFIYLDEQLKSKIEFIDLPGLDRESNLFNQKEYYKKMLIDNKNKINTLEDLANEGLILPIARSSIRKNINNLFKEKAIAIDPILEYGTEELIIESVRRNMGVGYVVKDAVSYLVEDKIIEYVNVDEQLPTMEINLVYINNYLTNVSKRFIKEEIYEDGV